MKKIWRWVLYPVLLLGLGFVAGAALVAHNYEKFVVDPVRYEQAYRAAMRANTLSLLRLNDVPAAIAVEEQMLDAGTLAATQRSNDPAVLPAQVVRALKQVKTYRELYPPQGVNAGRVRAALARMPTIVNYKKDCQAGLCRLLESKSPLTTDTMKGKQP